MTNSNPEILVIGGGIAGLSFGHFAAPRARVTVLERESHNAYHATGRSAAVSHQLEDDAVLQSLKVAGSRFLHAPPDGFCDTPLVTPCGILKLYSEVSWLERAQVFTSARHAGVAIETLTPGEAIERVPALRPASFDRAVFVPDDGHIDVHALVQSYQRGIHRNGGRILNDRDVELVVDSVDRVAVRYGNEILRGDWVVNAAGPWAAELAIACGATPVALTPKRRSAAVFEAPLDYDVATWPMVIAPDHNIYFKPESGGVMLSPMDQDPVAPCDARADGLRLAEGVECLRAIAPNLVPTSFRRTWGGLRTFSANGRPVVGPDPKLTNLFWLVGQGGLGIETSPVLGRGAAELVLDGHTDCFDAAKLAPQRQQPTE